MGRGSNLLYQQANSYCFVRENWKLDSFEHPSTLYLRNHYLSEYVDAGDQAYENILQHFYINSTGPRAAIGTLNWLVRLTEDNSAAYKDKPYYTQMREMEGSFRDPNDKINVEPPPEDYQYNSTQQLSELVFNADYKRQLVNGEIDNLIPVAFNCLEDGFDSKLCFAHEIDSAMNDSNNFNQWNLHNPDLVSRPTFVCASAVLMIQDLIEEEAYPYYLDKEKSLLFISGIPEDGIHFKRGAEYPNANIQAAMTCLPKADLVTRCPWLA